MLSSQRRREGGGKGSLKLSLKGENDGEEIRGGDSEGPSIEGAESRRKGGDGVDVYIGH